MGILPADRFVGQPGAAIAGRIGDVPDRWAGPGGVGEGRQQGAVGGRRGRGGLGGGHAAGWSGGGGGDGGAGSSGKAVFGNTDSSPGGVVGGAGTPWARADAGRASKSAAVGVRAVRAGCAGSMVLASR